MNNNYDEYFYNLIKNDEKLKPFKQDLGLLLISNALDYKIKKTTEIISNEIKENYYPTRLETLIAYSMYRIGYFRFKKPLKLYIDCVNQTDKDMDIYSKFSDGQSIFITKQAYSLKANKKQTIEVIQQERYTKTVTISNGKIYSYIDLNLSYKDITEIRIFKDDEELIYSQNFVNDEADYSYEMNMDGNLSIVVLLGNKNGQNIQIDDDLDIEYYISNDLNIKPENLGIIEDDYDLVINNIRIKENFEPFFDKEYMQQLVKYGRKNLGDITLNEDYRQFILKNVANIQVLKVWQEREETKQNGYDLANINKVFVCYIDTDNNPSKNEVSFNQSEMSRNITNAVQKYNYGKEVRIRKAIIKDLRVTIIVKTDEKFNGEYLKDLITGYYDDIHKKIDDSIIYNKVFSSLKNQLSVFHLRTYLSRKDKYMNEKIFRIKSENVNVVVSSVKE